MRFTAKTWLPFVAAGLAALALTAPTRAADADKFIPSDAVMAASVNVRQLLDSELFKKYGKDEAEKGLQDDKTKKTLEALGLDPLKDVDSLLMTAAGDLADKPTMLIVAHGKFNVEKIQAAAEKHAQEKPDDLKIVNEDGLTIYEGKSEGENKQQIFAVLDKDGKTILASTDKAYLIKAVKTPSSGPSDQLKTALAKAPAKDSAWMAMVVTDAMKEKMAAANPQTKNLATKLESVTGSVNVTNDVQTNLFIHTADAMTAADVKKMLNQVKPLLTLMAQSNEQAGPIVQDLVDNLKITTDENSVKVSLRVSEELIEKANTAEKKAADGEKKKGEEKEKPKEDKDK